MEKGDRTIGGQGGGRETDRMRSQEKGNWDWLGKDSEQRIGGETWDWLVMDAGGKREGQKLGQGLQRG